MLTEYIEQYINALKNKDAKTAQKIENEMYRLGMDKTTLITIVSQIMKGE